MTDLTDTEILQAFEVWKVDVRTEIMGMVDKRLIEYSIAANLYDITQMGVQVEDVDRRIRVLEKAQPPLKRLKRYLGL